MHDSRSVVRIKKMKIKKHKIKSDDTTLNFRVSKNLKNEIISVCNDRNTTLSKYLRDLLESVHDGSYGKEIIEANDKKAFLFSKDFVKLIIWIISMRNEDKVTETKEQLNYYLKTLKKSDEYLPNYITHEFNKVIADLLRVINESDYGYRYFRFTKDRYSTDTVDYSILHDFFTTSKLDAHIEV